MVDALGAVEGGLIEYHYVDAVKLAGHSCPAVAGVWLTTRVALARLYPGETPRRSEIRVELRQALDEGVAGVIASVASLVTGAANEGGFNGLAGRFRSLSWNLLITGNLGTKASWLVRSHP